MVMDVADERLTQCLDIGTTVAYNDLSLFLASERRTEG
jgi:hypothetical protein